LAVRQDTTDADASVGDEHRVVVVAQARGGGGSGVGTRESVEFSGPIGRSASADIASATVVGDATTIVGEHDVSALQQSWLIGVSHCSFCSPWLFAGWFCP
jgi:hypothetical protein